MLMISYSKGTVLASPYTHGVDIRCLQALFSFFVAQYTFSAFFSTDSKEYPSLFLLLFGGPSSETP